jgi:sulfite oxidase
MASFHFNRADEWKLEQGLEGAELPALDQTGSETVLILPHKDIPFPKDEAAIEAFGDRNKLFARELEGWQGYVIICSVSYWDELT